MPDTPPDKGNETAYQGGSLGGWQFVWLICVVGLATCCIGFGLQKVSKVDQTSSQRFSLHLWTSRVTLQHVERIEERVFRTDQGRLLYVGEDETFTLSESQ